MKVNIARVPSPQIYRLVFITELIFIKVIYISVDYKNWFRCLSIEFLDRNDQELYDRFYNQLHFFSTGRFLKWNL